MIVAVFGASGRTGRLLVPYAAEKGVIQRLHYRAVPADPAPDTATVVVGSLADPTAVREVLRSADAAVLLLGPKADARTVFTATATKAIIAGMKSQGVPRLLCLTGAMIGDMPGNVAIALRLMSFGIRRTGQAEMMDDRDAQERLVRNSKLTWTLIKPPRLSDDSATAFDAGPSVSVGMNSQASRAALSRFIVDELLEPKFMNQAVYIKNR
jgi:putative NADH-flavin reductase